MQSWFNQVPGITTPGTARHRALFLQRSETFLAQGRFVDGTKSRDPGNTTIDNLRIGLLMGKITASGAYAPSVLGVTTNAEAIGSTAIEAAAAVVTELVRRVGSTGTFKLIGPAAADGVVQEETVTYSAASGTSITVTAIQHAFIAGSFICPTDGSEYPRTMIPDTEGYGLVVTDQDGASLSVVEMPRMPVSGIVDSSQILPVWPSDTALQAWIVAQLNNGDGGQWVFDHNL